MARRLRIREVRITPLALPLRLKFEHAAASRDVSDPVIVRLTAAAPHAHVEGFGETLARPYVTGETAASVLRDLRELFVPLLAGFAPATFAEALEFIEQLPFDRDGRLVCAARAAIELALLDLAGRAFGRRAADAVGWLGLPSFGPPGCLPTARYSGVIVGGTPRKLMRLLRLQRWYGVRDFKLKVAVAGWEERLATAYARLRPALESGRATLRVDANGGWSLAEAHGAIETLELHGVSAIEQPLPDAEDDDLPFLAEQTACDLIADESLVTLEDGRRLIEAGGVRVFNIRIAKCGGLLPSLKLAALALSRGRDVQLGCLVGETSILSAAGVAFLEACPRVRFVEGALGWWLLRRDIATRRIQFGLGGRMRTRPGPGLGVRIRPKAIAALADAAPLVIRL